jgi:multiple sugar transport system permease protein
MIRNKTIFEQFGSWIERDGPLAAILTMPSLLWMVGIVGYPALLVFWMSLHAQSTVEAGAPFVGLDNFIRLSQSADFWHSARRTVVWTFANLIIIVPVGVLIASLLNLNYPGRRIIRSWSLLPWIFPIVVTILMWRWILDPVAGVANYIFLRLGLVDAPVSFFSNAILAMTTVIFVNFWRWAPFMVVVTLAALQTVPEDLHDAAKVDGASGLQAYIHITLPLIMPSIASTSFILAIWLFNMFPPIWLMTQGGPVDATTTLPIIIYKQGLQLFRMSDAATISVLLLFFFVLPVSILYFRYFGRERIESSRG